ncbi:hypothetical protein RRG08_022177 [Elysia crispata]|uniref:Uncharacterized protein n=1 Tax=Elysia crispata TaxID=231223 RepID=A0AAE1AHY0_9GAST|nr:hypothetical protein RRG08_022177 [Elysia crispata]
MRPQEQCQVEVVERGARDGGLRNQLLSHSGQLNVGLTYADKQKRRRGLVYGGMTNVKDPLDILLVAGRCSEPLSFTTYASFHSLRANQSQNVLTFCHVEASVQLTPSITYDLSNARHSHCVNIFTSPESVGEGFRSSVGQQQPPWLTGRTSCLSIKVLTLLLWSQWENR